MVISAIIDTFAFLNMKGACTLIFIVLICSSINPLVAQAPYRNQELTIRNDNDVYTFRDSDKYYSNGIIAKYRWIASPGRFLMPKNLPDSIKLIVETELNQKFFTPKFLENSDVEDFDRPYAGTLTAGYYLNIFNQPDRKLRYGLDLTLVGPATGAEAFQKWYHGVAGFPEPRGWAFQIPNELTFNLIGEYQRQFVLVERTVDVVTTSSASLGTGFTNAKQMVDIRLGTIQALNRSAFANSQIGKGSDKVLNQIYVYAGLGVEYVLQNITIQGSVWNDNAPHTENIVPWIRHMRFGFVTSPGKSTFKVVYNWLGPEVKGTRWHSYVGLELNVRFEPSKKRRNAYK